MCSSKNDNGHTYMQWWYAIVANLALFTYGLQAGWMSPMGKILQSENGPSGIPISDTTMTWIVSTMPVTAIAATPIYSHLVDTFGRKTCIISVGAFQMLCWIIKLISASTISLILARAVCGIAAGACFCVIPLYTKEISEDGNRGAIGSLVMLTNSVGFVTIYAMGAYMDYYTVLWTVVTIPIVMVLLMIKAPESPSYLIKIGKVEEAKSALALLRGRDRNEKYVANEILPMITEEEHFKSSPTLSYRSILSEKAYRNGLTVMLLTLTVHACGGNFAILTYAATIVRTSGVTFNPDLQTLSFPLVMLLGGAFSTAFIERMKRKTLFLACLLVTGLSHAVLGSVLLTQTYGLNAPGWLAVFAIIVSVFVNGFGIMPVPYVMMPEMFNFQVRARLMGINVSYAWFVSFVQVSVFGPTSRALGMHTMFYVFAGINMFFLVILWIMLPETKGKSVEEVEAELRGKKRTDAF